MWKCSECDYQNKRYFGMCPICRKGYGVESAKEEPKSSSPFYNPDFEYSGEPIGNLIKTVNPNEKDYESSFLTKYSGLNAILSSAKGFVDSQVCLIAALPGTGKSTLCISIADSETLYISTEENFKQINQRALRVNPETSCSIMNSTSISEILEAIRVFEGKMIIIDSINGIEFGVGYVTVAKFVNEITKAIKDTGKIAILTSQVNRDGNITGVGSLIHIVDSVFHLERSEVSSNIIATSSKNRFGEIGSVAVFQHRADGFVEVDVDHMITELEIGCTYTTTRFGHKNMTIAIESLVSESQSAYGLRRSNGYNQNRLIQLIGVISYFGEIDLRTKDIYVSISSGLYTDDISIELAMANSILSSYYGKAVVKESYGEVRLNGKLVNAHIDGKEISHIDELISLYK